MANRYGLSEIYHPPDGFAVAAHIVFVHGLFGHPFETWSAVKSRSRVEEAAFWPQQFLPKVIPNTRIFTWGYNADIDGFLASASQNTVHQHAGNLLSDLSDLWTTPEEKAIPLIFVAYSLGGIIVKDALNQSRLTEGTRLKDITPATFAVLFLGTPHRGSRTASLGRIAYNITTIATKRPNVQLLRALERNAETLDRIGDAFSQTILKYKIQVYSFREEKETRKYMIFNTMVVEADSAKIGDAREEVGSIPTNHQDMTKFSTPEDVGLKRISAQLRRWIETIKSSSGTPAFSDDIECLESLNLAETKLRMTQVEPAHANTCRWLYDPDTVSFIDWLQSPDQKWNRPYWIQGKPGSGKSTLMKFAMSQHKTMELLEKDRPGPWTLVGFFFHDRGVTVQKSLKGMTSELLYSILRQNHSLIRFAIPRWKQLRQSQRKQKPEWDLDSLRSALKAVLWQDEVSARFCLFLDALDEHGGENNRLTDLGQDLHRKSPVAILPAALWHLSGTLRDGTTFSALMVELEKTPPELEELYRHILRRIDPRYSSETFVMLQVILCSLVPLDLSTFAECVDYVLARCFPIQRVPNAYSMESLGKDSFASKNLRLASRSGGLLEIVSEVSTSTTGPTLQNDRVQFIHQSAKEFIEKSRLELGLKDWNRELNKIAMKTGHEFLLIASSSCAPWVESIKHDMATYAKLTDEHVKADINLRASYIEEVKEIFATRKSSASPGTTEAFNFQWWTSTQLQPVKYLIKKMVDINNPLFGLMGWTFAVTANLISYIESATLECEAVMLNDLVQLVSGPSLIPSGICPIDRRAMIKALVSRGFDLGEPFAPILPYDIHRVSFGESRSFRVIASDRWTLLASLCLQSNVNACDEPTRLDLAKYIMDLGSDVEQYVEIQISRLGDSEVGRGVQRVSPLELSVRYGDASFVRLLLGVGAKSDSTLIEYAAMRGDESILQALKDYGIPFPRYYRVKKPPDDHLPGPGAFAVGNLLAVCSGGIGAKPWPDISPNAIRYLVENKSKPSGPEPSGEYPWATSTYGEV